MARATIAPTALTNGYPTLPVAANSLDVNFQAADAVNLNQAAFGSAAALLLLVWNTHATNAGDFTVTSAADALGRSGDVTDYSLAAGEIGAFYAPRNGWRQGDGNLYFDGSANTIKFAVIKL